MQQFVKTLTFQVEFVNRKVYGIGWFDAAARLTQYVGHMYHQSAWYDLAFAELITVDRA